MKMTRYWYWALSRKRCRGSASSWDSCRCM